MSMTKNINIDDCIGFDCLLGWKANSIFQEYSVTHIHFASNILCHYMYIQ